MYPADKKVMVIKDKLRKNCECQGKGCPVCTKKVYFASKLRNANIPINYWFLKYNTFTGPENVKNITLSYVKNISENYDQGKGLCFVGQYGTGKTFSMTSILKYAIYNSYSAYYTTLSDMIQYMSDYETQSEFLGNVNKVDFLVIDEVDSRHFSTSDQAQQYFGSSFERIIRYRTQNMLPTLIGSNNSSLDEVFTGQYKRVVDSLLSRANEVIPVLGKDFRKK